jgi:polysaccharide pyruvyl transferase WcaK-like protein
VKILLTHGYSDSNKGDSAIAVATIETLKCLYPGAAITLHSTFREADPEFSRHNRHVRQHGIAVEEGIMPSPYLAGEPPSGARNAVALARLVRDYAGFSAAVRMRSRGRRSGARPFRAVKTLRDADLVVVKGGQFLYNDTGGVRGALFLWRTLQPIRAAIGLRKPTVVLGHSVGPFRNRLSLTATVRVLKHTDMIFVRETLSERMLAGRVEPRRLALAPDLAFLIERAPCEVALDPGTAWIGVTLVNWIFPGRGDPAGRRARYLRRLTAALADAYRRLRLVPVFIPQVTVRHYGMSDVDVIRRARELLSAAGVRSHFVEEDLSPEQMVDLYGQCALLIGTRLHSCILASCASRPVIAIRYQGFKTQGVMAMLGCEHLVHEIDALDPARLYRDIETVWRDREALSRRIGHTVRSLRTELRERIRRCLLGITGTRGGAAPDGRAHGVSARQGSG